MLASVLDQKPSVEKGTSALVAGSDSYTSQVGQTVSVEPSSERLQQRAEDRDAWPLWWRGARGADESDDIWLMRLLELLQANSMQENGEEKRCEDLLPLKVDSANSDEDRNIWEVAEEGELPDESVEKLSADVEGDLSEADDKSSEDIGETSEEAEDLETETLAGREKPGGEQKRLGQATTPASRMGWHPWDVRPDPTDPEQKFLSQRGLAESLLPGGKKRRECYVGNLPQNKVDESMLKEAFNRLFYAIPSFIERYPDVVDTVKSVFFPPKSEGMFAFVEFVDDVLTTTAIAMSGFELCGRAVRVGRPQHYILPPNGEIPALDLQPLREKGLLPPCQEDCKAGLDPS
eukprot:g6517.t1